MRPSRPAGSARSAVFRVVLLITLLAGAFAALRWSPLGEHLSRDALAAALFGLRKAWWAPLALVGLYLLLSPLGLPVSPLVFAGGAVFGVFWGTFYNFLGSLAGALASYLLAEAMGRDLVVHLVGESRVRRIEGMLERHGFWAIVRVRFIPIPFALVNFGAALVGVRLAPFFTASALGLAPSMLIYTYFGHTLAVVAMEDRPAVLYLLAAVLLLALVLTVFVPLGRARTKRRKTGSG